MNVFALLGVIFLLAFLVEALVEYLFGAICAHFDALKPYSWLLMYVAAAVGVLGAFNYRFDLLYLLGAFLGAQVGLTTYGMVLTGLAIGRGANFVHDLIMRFFKPKPWE